MIDTPLESTDSGLPGHIFIIIFRSLEVFLIIQSKLPILDQYLQYYIKQHFKSKSD